LPLESNAKWLGESRFDAVGFDEFLPLLEVKLSKPITTEAGCPFANAYARGVTQAEIKKRDTTAKLAKTIRRFLFPGVIF